ncbi:MAG: CarD family transcriptional regulator [Anaeroplasma sp.]
MFEIGDVVIYTTYGICKITEQISRNFNGQDNDYFVLVPLSEAKTQLTIPVNNPITLARLHSLLSRDEIISIIDQIPFLEAYWVENDNERKKIFAEIIKSGNRIETIKLIKSIKNHQLSLKNKSRKLHASDEQSMKDAEKLIIDEFAYVLNIDKKELYNQFYEELTK